MGKKIEKKKKRGSQLELLFSKKPNQGQYNDDNNT